MPFLSFWKEARKQQNQIIIDYIVCDLIFSVISNRKGKLCGEFWSFLAYVCWLKIANQFTIFHSKYFIGFFCIGWSIS